MSDGEFFDEREDIVVVGEEVFFLLFFGERRGFGVVEEVELTVDFEGGDEMGLLEVGAEVAVFGYVSQEL